VLTFVSPLGLELPKVPLWVSLGVVFLGWLRLWMKNSIWDEVGRFCGLLTILSGVAAALEVEQLDMAS
jgi:hypothetical protein